MKILKNNYVSVGFAKRLRLEDETSRHRCQMHDCLRYPMRMCRWAGFFPIEGLDKPTISGLRYNLKSFYTIYYVATVFGGVLSTIMNFLWLLENELSLPNISNCVFYSTALASMFMFGRLAQQWPMFMRKVREIERSLQEIRTSNKTNKYCNRLAFTIMFMAMVEHILSVIYEVSLTIKCMTSWNQSTTIEIAAKYYTYTAPYYVYISYSPIVIGFIFKVVNLQATFLWSFTDVLTICFSIYLISYFRDLNKVIDNRKGNSASEWELLRTHYSQVVQLVMEVDKRLSGFILQAFVVYIFYICLQLFHTLKSSPSLATVCNERLLNEFHRSAEYLTYYLFSFFFLVLRFVVTSLLAANVSLVAKKPLMALDIVSPSDYGIEVRRFRLQILYTPVAMSGIFFFVTRPMLLKVVGSIFTYELVMLQLH